MDINLLKLVAMAGSKGRPTLALYSMRRLADAGLVLLVDNDVEIRAFITQKGWAALIEAVA